MNESVKKVGLNLKAFPLHANTEEQQHFGVVQEESKIFLNNFYTKE